jgi:predicted transcriptional regulator
MARLTVTLDDAVHQAVKEAAARRRRTDGELIDKSLRCYGIKRQEDFEQLVVAARERSGLAGDEAMELAVRETTTARHRRTATDER